MKKGLTELVFILDRSGSMSPLTDDTIGGFNSMIEKQKAEEGACLVSTILFANDSEVIHDRLPLAEVPAMTRREYCAAGCTALYDALGGAIRHIAAIHRYAREEDVPERTLFVITTDGMENASRKYGGREVRKMVEDAKKKDSWEFLFLAANIGIAREASMNYTADKADTAKLYRRISRAVGAMRGGAPMEACIAEMKSED